MTTPLRIRVDEPCYAKALAFFIESGVEIVAKCYDKPRDENPHYHLYALSSVSLDALRRRRSRHFRGDESMTGNGAMSIAPMGMPEEYKAYMCKGSEAFKDKGQWSGKSQPIIDIYDTSIFTKTIEEYHNDFWNTRVEFKKQRVRSKPFTQVVVEQFEEEFKPNDIIERLNDGEDVFEEEYLDVECVIEFIKTKYCNVCKGFDVPIISRVMCMIIHKYKPCFNGRGDYISKKFNESVFSYMLRGGL